MEDETQNPHLHSPISEERANFAEVNGDTLQGGNPHAEVHVASGEPGPERDLLPGEAAIREGQPERTDETALEHAELGSEPGDEPGDEPGAPE